MSTRENETSGPVAFKAQGPVGQGPTSVGTGDPNPKGFANSAITSAPSAVPGKRDFYLTVPFDSGEVSFTVFEEFDDRANDALKVSGFILECTSPEVASIVIPPEDGRKWKDYHSRSLLKPGASASSVFVVDPGQEVLDNSFDLISLDVQLKLHKKGDVRVRYTTEVANQVEGHPIVTSNEIILTISIT